MRSRREPARPSSAASAPASTARTEDVYDFWRPAGESVPRVDGHLSNRCYTDMFTRVFAAHREATGLDVEDYAALCFHLPYTKMGRKALACVLTPEQAQDVKGVVDALRAAGREDLL